jgi:hypothetical protein
MTTENTSVNQAYSARSIQSLTSSVEQMNHPHRKSNIAPQVVGLAKLIHTSGKLAALARRRAVGWNALKRR